MRLLIRIALLLGIVSGAGFVTQEANPPPLPASFVDSLREHAATQPQDEPATPSRTTVPPPVQTTSDITVGRDASNATLLDAAHRAHVADYESALTLALFVADASDDPSLQQRARLLAGWSALQLGDAHMAVSSLEAAGYDDSDPTFGYVRLWEARATFVVADYETAVAASADAARVIERDIGEHEARMLNARASLFVTDDVAGEVARTIELLDEYPDYPWRNAARLEMALAEHRAGDDGAASRRLYRLMWDRPWSPLLPRAVALLDQLNAADEPARTFDERLEHARTSRAWRQWRLADREFQDLLAAAAGDRSLENRMRLELVQNAYEDARFDDAIHWLDAIETDGGIGVARLDLARWRARTLGRLGQRQLAYDTYVAGFSSALSRADHEILGDFAFDVGLWTQAISHREHHWSTSQWRDFNGVFLRYLAAQHTEAARGFRALRDHSNGANRARATYWLARTLHLQGEHDEAFALLDEVLAERPREYYGVQARNRLMEWRGDASVASDGQRERATLPLSPAAGRVHLRGPGSEPDGTYSGFRAFYGDEHLDEFGRGDADDGSLRRLADEWGTDFPSAAIAAGLYEAGALEDARRVFRDVAFEFRVLDRLFAQGREVSTRRPITLERRLWQPEVDNRRAPGYWWGMDNAALRYPGPGSDVQAWVDRHERIRAGRAELRPLIEAATREVGDAYLIRQGALDLDLPDPIETEQQRLNWRSAFPRAYARMLQQHAERYDLNPYLFWALMLVESAFNPDTVSIADAYGLTQVIPKTGELVVQRMGLGDTGIHALLEAPAALAFGSYYLSELLHKFQGQEMLACVAYNAGAHAVARWLDWRGELMELDEFIESVPFDQSRRYAQRIVQHMSTYRWVWFGTAELYIGNALDVRHEDNINF